MDDHRRAELVARLYDAFDLTPEEREMADALVRLRDAENAIVKAEETAFLERIRNTAEEVSRELSREMSDVLGIPVTVSFSLDEVGP